MKRLSLFSFLFSIILSSCNVHCPDFNADILNWIPYKIGDTISLMKNNEPVKFIVTNTFLEHTSKYAKYSLKKCGVCDNYFGFDAANETINFELSSNNDQDIKQSYFAFGSSYFINGKTLLNDITINGSTYQDILVFERDSNSYIWKVILAKNRGIIAIYSNDTVMVPVNNVIREASVNDYNIKNKKGCD